MKMGSCRGCISDVVVGAGVGFVVGLANVGIISLIAYGIFKTFKPSISAKPLFLLAIGGGLLCALFVASAMLFSRYMSDKNQF
ncbi:MAG: hypothetical protein H7A39_05540 [Chlamydiales bacterium]|nr:hypothetical protein [Chlamydiales bacterium]